MDAFTCHLCGEEMEPDVVLLQGDTCDLCYLHAVPVEGATAFHDIANETAVVSIETIEAFDTLFS